MRTHPRERGEGRKWEEGGKGCTTGFMTNVC